MKQRFDSEQGRRHRTLDQRRRLPHAIDDSCSGAQCMGSLARRTLDAGRWMLNT